MSRFSRLQIISDPGPITASLMNRLERESDALLELDAGILERRARTAIRKQAREHFLEHSVARRVIIELRALER